MSSWFGIHMILTVLGLFFPHGYISDILSVMKYSHEDFLPFNPDDHPVLWWVRIFIDLIFQVISCLYNFYRFLINII